uniref:Uncharacterized protein n=1 Tax=Oryza brachyantha TaxID=4533 RepID=J3LM16_ORYBR
MTTEGACAAWWPEVGGGDAVLGGVWTRVAGMSWVAGTDRRSASNCGGLDGNRWSRFGVARLGNDNNEDLTGITPVPRGAPQIEREGQSVRAGDRATDKLERITISGDERKISKDEIERMIHKADEFADEDRRVKERVDARNSLELYVYSMKNTVDDKMGDAMEGGEKEKVEGAVREAYNWLNGNHDARSPPPPAALYRSREKR